MVLRLLSSPTLVKDDDDDAWQREPRNSRGEWTSGSGGAATTTVTLPGNVNYALADTDTVYHQPGTNKGAILHASGEATWFNNGKIAPNSSKPASGYFAKYGYKDVTKKLRRSAAKNTTQSTQSTQSQKPTQSTQETTQSSTIESPPSPKPTQASVQASVQEDKAPERTMTLGTRTVQYQPGDRIYQRGRRQDFVVVHADGTGRRYLSTISIEHRPGRDLAAEGYKDITDKVLNPKRSKQELTNQLQLKKGLLGIHPSLVDQAQDIAESMGVVRTGYQGKIIPAIDLSGIKPDVQKDVLDAMQNFHEEHPDLKVNVSVTNSAGSGPGKIGNGAAADTSVRPGFSMIRLSKSVFKNSADDINNMVDMSRRGKWLADGHGTGATAIMTHELGHAYTITKANAYLNHIVKGVVQGHDVISEISKYAATNSRETAAEAYASTHLGKPTPLATQVMQAIDEYQPKEWP